MNVRIDFLLERDGREETIEWVMRTLSLYEAAIQDVSRYSPHHKELMAKEAGEMRRFLQETQKE